MASAIAGKGLGVRTRQIQSLTDMVHTQTWLKQAAVQEPSNLWYRFILAAVILSDRLQNQAIRDSSWKQLMKATFRWKNCLTGVCSKSTWV